MYAHKRSAVFFSHKAEHGVLVSPVAVQPLLLLQFCAMGSSGRGISAFCLVAAMYIATVSPTRAQTTVEPVSIAPRGSVTCFSCGQPGVDPHADNPGSYCDVTIETNICPATSKIYNFTCDIMDRMGRSGHWERKCPDGVRSCFHAAGRYKGQEPVFRGCAGATYAHDEGCQRSMQTVSVNAGNSNVDIEINLCYCNGDNCNMDISSAPRAASQAWVALMTAGLVGMSSAPSTQHGILGISLLALISSQPSSSSAESTLVAPLEVAGDGTVTCYACGQPEANPNASFCDVTITPHHCNLETTKIYNLSCSLMDNMREPRLKRLWERACPTGVKSCFYAEGGFPNEDPVKFRGCAGVPYRDPFHECVRRKQAVPVYEGQRSVDVDVTLCYCNDDLCNEVLNGASKDGDTAALISVTVISAFATLLSR